MQALAKFCFFFPLITNLLNIQGFVTKFVSPSLAQIFAYSNLFLLFLGVLIVFKRSESFTPLIKGWLIFYLIYYAMALLANSYFETSPELLKTLVPVVYFFAFSVYLSEHENRETTAKILAFTFFISSILLIYFNAINFSLDFEGIHEFRLERAGGVYGDANNACVSSILSFIFIFHVFKPINGIQKVIKAILLAISSYAIFITFSKTGFIVFILILGITFRKLFTHKRLAFSILIIPIIFVISINYALSSNTLSFAQKQRVESLVNLITLNTKEVGLSDRDVLFNNMLNFIYENPILGNGVNFSVMIRGHNTIFGIWADAGIFAFLAFLALLTAYFKKTLSVRDKYKFFILSILLTLTIYMLTLQTIINQGYLMTVFILIAYLIDNHQKLEI